MCPLEKNKTEINEQYRNGREGEREGEEKRKERKRGRERGEKDKIEKMNVHTKNVQEYSKIHPS